MGDVGMIERGEDLRFASKPRQAFTVGRYGFWQHLDRDVPIELGIARAIYLTHAADAERGCTKKTF
jgi:hypothetical protein